MKTGPHQKFGEIFLAFSCLNSCAYKALQRGSTSRVWGFHAAMPQTTQAPSSPASRPSKSGPGPTAESTWASFRTSLCVLQTLY